MLLALLGVLLISILLGAFAADWDIPNWLMNWWVPLCLLVAAGAIYLLTRLEPGTLQIMLQQQYGEKKGRRVLYIMLILYAIGGLGLIAIYSHSISGIGHAVAEGTLEK